MTTKLKHLSICLVAGASFLLLGTLLSAALNTKELSVNSQECIRCHVSTYNQGTKNQQMHPPFWERQCVACHLEEGASWSAQKGVTKGAITGTIVNQDTLWRKLQTFSGSNGAQLDHLISIPFLQRSTAYRFRIVVSPKGFSAKGPKDKTLWLGLLLDELADSENARPQVISVNEPSANIPQVKMISVFREGKTTFIGWQTIHPVYGWVELQTLVGLTLESAVADPSLTGTKPNPQEEHPPLRSPEDLAIKACYQCHPESTLGTSHPVRLYGGNEVQIPAELPTVEGMLTCVTCHDPHGAPEKNLVRETITTKLCVACHYTFKNSSKSTMFD